MTEPRVWNEDISLPYAYALGPVNTKFFEGLINKKIYGTRCNQCGRVLVPARMFCVHCFRETDEWVEVKQEGTVVTWTLIKYAYQGQPFKPPYISALVRLDGADTALVHFLGDIDLSNTEEAVKNINIGMRVKAVWNEERDGRVFDIKHFAPVGA